MARTRDLAIATLAGFGAIQIFPVLLSPVNEVPRLVREEGQLVEIRRQEAIASAIGMLAGWAATETADSPLPLLFTALGCLLMVWLYESAIKRGEKVGG